VLIELSLLMLKIDAIVNEVFFNSSTQIESRKRRVNIITLKSCVYVVCL